TLSIVVPVTDEQEIIRGLLVVDIPGFPNAIGFGSLLQYWSANYNLELMDDSGNVLLGGPNTISNEKSRHWDEIIALMRENLSGVAEHREDEEGMAHIVSFALLNQVPWAVTVEQHEAQLF
ncbi:MAG: cache domain-containing protein, partial [Nanoarchaeota archaeon]|nr:cache domain-containing protein [Nanoarchaeota archaeon]